MPHLASLRAVAGIRLSLVLLALVAIFGGTGGTSVAQERTIPDFSHFAAIETLYRGEYQRALRNFNSELRGAVRTAQTRWVDSICYHAMLGETHYQMGDNRAALAEFDAACNLLLSYPNWLMKVEFRDPRPDSNAARRIAPWGQSTRQVTYGAFPNTMLVSQGEIITEQRLAQGGAIQSLQMWKVNVIEIVRATALSIRRRNEILGPLGPEDRLSKSLVDTLARGNNAPRNHWSNAWTDLLLALAQHGTGQQQQAVTQYSRAVLVDGRYDHPLTGAALLGQAQLAYEAGNPQAAMQMATEATYAAYAYEDFDVLGEAMRLGHQAFMATGGEGTYPPLAGAVAWTERNQLSHLAALGLVSEAEELATAGDVKGATTRLRGVDSRRRELATGRLGPLLRHVEALTAYASGDMDGGDKFAAEGLRLQRTQSLRHTQIELTNERVDGGDLSSRLAVGLYSHLLRDPLPVDWSRDPLDVIANTTTSYEGTLDRWLAAALDRKEVLGALEITEIAKRRRYWLAQPLGGRLLAMRHLLESNPDLLSPPARLQRQHLLTRSPRYAQLQETDRALRREVAAEPLVDASGNTSSKQQGRLKKLRENSLQRDAILRQMALRREPSDLDLPPRASGVGLQKMLAEGQALVVFHQSGANMYAFLLVSEGYHLWRVPDAGPLRDGVSDLLRAVGNFGRNRTFTAKELASEEWQATASQFANQLFNDSRLDLNQTTELIIVPDGVLWHVPFELLAPKIGGNSKMLIERIPLRYAPTAGFALGDTTPPRPVRTTGIVPPSGSGSQGEAVVADLEGAVANAVRLGSSMVVPSPVVASVIEQLVVLQEVDLDPAKPYGVSPLPIDRTGNQGGLDAWLRLPVADCQRILLPALHTSAETGLKASRRRSRTGGDQGQTEGTELFHLSCSLLASGAKTVLVSRWYVPGQTSRELVREFVRELPNMAADQAWQRSVLLAQRMPLDPEQEPRMKRPDSPADIPDATHPFLWSGYLLVDTGYDAERIRQAAEAAEAAAAAQEAGVPGQPAAPGQMPPAGFELPQPNATGAVPEEPTGGMPAEN